jgi:hypothetical protein
MTQTFVSLGKRGTSLRWASQKPLLDHELANGCHERGIWEIRIDTPSRDLISMGSVSVIPAPLPVSLAPSAPTF